MASLGMDLKDLFHRNGYVRVPDLEKRKMLTAAKYKKGWEVRLVLRSESEVGEVRRLLTEQGLNAGRPFLKAKQWVQPVYGKNAVEFFRSNVRDVDSSQMQPPQS